MARAVQRKRFTAAASPHVRTNAQMTQRLIQRTCALAPEARQLLDTLVMRLGFSEHARPAILRVARTIADLAGAPDIRPEHLAEAVQYHRRAPKMA